MAANPPKLTDAKFPQLHKHKKDTDNKPDQGTLYGDDIVKDATVTVTGTKGAKKKTMWTGTTGPQNADGSWPTDLRVIQEEEDRRDGTKGGPEDVSVTVVNPDNQKSTLPVKDVPTID